jgi:hypothetical protein
MPNFHLDSATGFGADVFDVDDASGADDNSTIADFTTIPSETNSSFSILIGYGKDST